MVIFGVSVLVVLSSTVIPMKTLADRGQFDSQHGRTMIGSAG